MVVLTGNKLRVIDFKTSRSRWTEAKIQEAAPQMLLYAALVRPLAQELGVGEVLLEWSVITKARQPAVEIHTLTPQPKQIARTKAVVQRVWDAIKAGHFYPSPSAMGCATCPYAKPCKQWEY